MGDLVVNTSVDTGAHTVFGTVSSLGQFGARGRLDHAEFIREQLA